MRACMIQIEHFVAFFKRFTRITSQSDMIAFPEASRYNLSNWTYRMKHCLVKMLQRMLLKLVECSIKVTSALFLRHPATFWPITLQPKQTRAIFHNFVHLFFFFFLLLASIDTQSKNSQIFERRSSLYEVIDQNVAERFKKKQCVQYQTYQVTLTAEWSSKYLLDVN